MYLSVYLSICVYIYPPRAHTIKWFWGGKKLRTAVKPTTSERGVCVYVCVCVCVRVCAGVCGVCAGMSVCS